MSTRPSNGLAADLKAPDLRALYLASILLPQDELLDQSSRVERALDVLADVNRITGERVKQKWIFCDLIQFIIRHQANNELIDPDLLAEAYVAFDLRRLCFNRVPDDLLDGEVTPEDQALYDYIQAFRVEGGKQANLERRAEVMEIVLRDCLS